MALAMWRCKVERIKANWREEQEVVEEIERLGGAVDKYRCYGDAPWPFLRVVEVPIVNASLDSRYQMRVFGVSFAECDLTPGVVRSLRLDRLRYLAIINLAHTKVTANDLEEIVTRAPDVTKVGLFRCDRIDDSAAPVLNRLRKLEGVNLCATRITDRTLLSLEHLEKLRTIICRDTGVTEAGVNNFRSRRPDIKVVYP